MKSSPSPFPILAPNSCVSLNSHILKLNYSCKAAAIIPSPPPSFNFKNEILDISAAAIAKTHPELLDLAKNGTLILVKKSQYGAVPPWRSEFVEPEAIWILGTNHISPESASHVERVITLLSSSVEAEWFFRAGIMYAPAENGDKNQQLRSSMFSLSGNGFFGTVGRSINLGGQTALALRLLLATLSSKLSSDTNRPFGDEFRAARKASEELGAQLVLGDRPIEITLERAWSSLTWKEKVSLISSVVRGITSTSSDLSNKALEEPSGDNSSFQLYEQLSFSYPSLLPPLVYERDTFLGWSLKRSKAVNKSKNVVGVIGNGHMNGVVYSLVCDTGDLRFRDLAGKRSDSWAASIAKGLLRDTVIGVVIWFVYEKLRSPL